MCEKQTVIKAWCSPQTRRFEYGAVEYTLQSSLKQYFYMHAGNAIHTHYRVMGVKKKSAYISYIHAVHSYISLYLYTYPYIYIRDAKKKLT